MSGSGYGDARMVIPSVRCAGTSRRSGERCRRHARPGSTVCHLHGGNLPSNVRKGAERVALAALMTTDPRPVWEVVLDAVHTVDSVAREAKLSALAEGENLTPESLDRLVESARLAHALGSTAITTKAAEQAGRSYKLEAQVFARVVDYWLGAATGWLASIGMRAADVDRLNAWSGEVLRPVLGRVAQHLHDRDRGRPTDPKSWDLPDPPPPPSDLAELRLVPEHLVRKPLAIAAAPFEVPTLSPADLAAGRPYRDHPGGTP